MAFYFVVEDGTGLSNSTAFTTTQEFRDYYDLQDYDYSSLVEDQIKKYIVRATTLINNMYMSYWKGNVVSDTQRLSWPRENCYYIDGIEIDDESVPPEIKNATIEMAYALQSGYNLAPVNTDEGSLREEEVRVDKIEQRLKYSPSKSMYTRPTVTAVDDALARITGGSGSLGNLNIVRV